MMSKELETNIKNLSIMSRETCAKRNHCSVRYLDGLWAKGLGPDRVRLDPESKKFGVTIEAEARWRQQLDRTAGNIE